MLFLLYSKVNEFYICVHMYIYTCVHAKSLHLCLTLLDPMDHSQLGTSVQGILQARILEWVAMAPSKGIFPT